jgi:predicted PurR-regulated permease PerM
VILGFAAILGAGGWLLFTQLVGVANDLPAYRANIDRKLAAIHSPNNSAFSRARREVEHISDELGLANSLPIGLAPDVRNQSKPLGSTPEHPVQVKEVTPSTGRLDALGGVLEPLATALLSIVFTFFVLLQREDLRNRLIRLSGDRNLSVVTEAMDDASRRISRYFRLLLTVNLVYGSIIFGALHFLGLPHALLFGCLAGLFRFIPYLGPPIAGFLPTALSVAVFHGWSRSLTIVGIFTCLEIITANYAEPRIYGKHTGLSSLAVLLAAAFWTLIWGPVGLLLSVPLTVCLVVMGHHVPALDFLTVMLGDQAPMPPWTCFYQRLLARDEREAAEIVERYASEKPLADVFDSVLVPVLVMSEEDRLHRDLEDSSVQFIREKVRELIEELGFRENQGANGSAMTPVAPAARHESNALRVMCVPARDETDELAALMLAQVLESIHVSAFAAPVQREEEILAAVAREKPGIVFLVGIPPFAFARSHRLYRSLRSHFPQLRIMVGIWNDPENSAEIARRIGGENDLRVFVRLSEALAEVQSLINSKNEPAQAGSAVNASVSNPPESPLDNQTAA